MSMSDLNYPLAADGGPDDLPRTLRRERDAREREARERLAKEREAMAATPSIGGPSIASSSMGGPPMAGAGMSGPGMSAGMADPYAMSDPSYGQGEPLPSVVRRIDVPFFQLVTFFLKAAFAMVPAILVLGVILWGIGQTLQTFFPQLVKMQILIWFPN
jgi:hypothetical protein